MKLKHRISSLAGGLIETGSQRVLHAVGERRSEKRLLAHFNTVPSREVTEISKTMEQTVSCKSIRTNKCSH